MYNASLRISSGSCSENELYKYTHVLHKTYVKVYTSTNAYGVGNVIDLNTTYWIIINDFSSSTYLLNYVYVSIVLKKYVAMFIFGCGIGNARI